MAKSKGSKAARKPAPASPVRKPTVLAMKGSPEWKDWLDRAATHCRLTTSSLVDLALTRYVRDQGFTEPPPER